jgi:DNA-binding response OmpR family regulator
VKVLLVDDNQDITTMLSEFLKEKGIDIEVTNDPRKGLERIKEEQYDAVLLDIHMPGLTGTDLIQALENEKILQDQKIIILSGEDLTSNQINDLLEKDGITDLLKKPTPLNDIVSAIVN